MAATSRTITASPILRSPTTSPSPPAAPRARVGRIPSTRARSPGRTIWRQLGAAGVSWGVYQESMPSTCYTGSQSSNRRTGPYVLRHNPATSFAEIAHSRACKRVKPLTKMTRKLPRVSFVTPAICNDMHGVGDSSFGASCRTGSSAIIRRGDQWLRRWVPRWRKAGATVIITFDEGSSALYTIAVGRGVRRSVDHHQLQPLLPARLARAAIPPPTARQRASRAPRCRSVPEHTAANGLVLPADVPGLGLLM